MLFCFKCGLGSGGICMMQIHVYYVGSSPRLKKRSMCLAYRNPNVFYYDCCAHKLLAFVEVPND